MEWTDIRLTVAKADAENAEAVATLIAEGGIYIEDYSDIEQQVAEIAHVDLIEQELLDKPRDTVIIHLYLEPGASQVETLALIAARMEAAGIPYTVETEGVEQEDWQNGWRKYYHPMEIGSRLAVVPSWQQYDTDRVKLILDPGLAFGTGGHETTSLCLEALDEQVRGGERVLDIGTGSGILAIAALKLGFLRILTGQDPEKVETKEVHINEYGTDDYSRLALTYPGGCKAESVQTIGQELERNARIAGTKGSIFLPDFQHAETMTLEVEGKEPEVIRCPVDINGFEYEIREASRCVKQGRTGSDRYTPQDSLALTRLMYDTRMSWGMKFAGEV